MKEFLKKIDPRRWAELSSPVTLGFAGLSLIVFLFGAITSGASNRALFSVYRASPADPLSFLRVFLHVLGHQDFSHYAANMGMVLLLGPMAERQHGSRLFLVMLIVTALLTGLVHILLSPGTAAMGASGIVFMLIFLSAVSEHKQGKVPLTLVLVALIFLGREIVDGLFTKDNISQLSHIMGAVCGLLFGMMLKRRKAKQ